MDHSRIEKISKALADETRLRIFEAISANDHMNCGEIVSMRGVTPATVSLNILRWCETVAGVTPRIETISPQFMWSFAEMASKILRRVSSARAFDIFSIWDRSICLAEV